MDFQLISGVPQSSKLTRVSLKLNGENEESVATGSQTSTAVLATVAKLNELACLEDNWDSYGGHSPTKVALMAAAQIALELFSEATPTPDIFPVPNGSIQFEWSCQQVDIEIEVVALNAIIVSYENLETGYAWEEGFSHDLTEVAKILLEVEPKQPLLKVV